MYIMLKHFDLTLSNSWKYVKIICIYTCILTLEFAFKRSLIVVAYQHNLLGICIEQWIQWMVVSSDSMWFSIIIIGVRDMAEVLQCLYWVSGSTKHVLEPVMVTIMFAATLLQASQ